MFFIIGFMSHDESQPTTQCVFASGAVRTVDASSPEIAARWTRTNTAIFIENFNQFTCLWKVTSVEYKNRDARQPAQQNLQIVVKDIVKNVILPKYN